MTPTIAPSATRQRPPLPDVFSFGQSVQGRDLVAQRFGSGGALILLVGGIHTGFESNTVTLVEQMVAHYAGSPGAVLPGVTLVLVPALNPDGRTFGREVRGRFNANNVDLNRNWGCEWEPVAEFGEGQVNPGAAPFSEPETLMLAALINDLRPDVVVFYHSAANGVFPGRCDDVSNGEALAQIYAAASNYPFRESFDEYEVTGSAPDWVDSLGIPALDVELATADLSELGRNLDGVVALQCWLMGEAASVYTACLR